MRLSRRSFLLLLPPLAGVVACGRTIDPAAARESLIGLLKRRNACAKIGEAYLAKHPEQRDLDGLTRALASDLDWSSGRADSKLEVAVARRVREDFEAGRVAEVSGWTLAETEVRLCALVALAQPAA